MESGVTAIGILNFYGEWSYSYRNSKFPHDVAGLRPATSLGVHYTTSCNTQSSAPEDG